MENAAINLAGRQLNAKIKAGRGRPLLLIH